MVENKDESKEDAPNEGDTNCLENYYLILVPKDNIKKKLKKKIADDMPISYVPLKNENKHETEEDDPEEGDEFSSFNSTWVPTHHSLKRERERERRLGARNKN